MEISIGCTNFRSIPSHSEDDHPTRKAATFVVILSIRLVTNSCHLVVDDLTGDDWRSAQQC